MAGTKKATALAHAWINEVLLHKPCYESRQLTNHIKNIICPLIEGAFEVGAWRKTDMLSDRMYPINHYGSHRLVVLGAELKISDSFLGTDALAQKFQLVISYEIPSFKWGDVYLIESRPSKAYHACVFASHFEGYRALKRYLTDYILPYMQGKLKIDEHSGILPATGVNVLPKHIHNPIYFGLPDRQPAFAKTFNQSRLDSAKALPSLEPAPLPPEPQPQPETAATEQKNEAPMPEAPTIAAQANTCHASRFWKWHKAVATNFALSSGAEEKPPGFSIGLHAELVAAAIRAHRNQALLSVQIAANIARELLDDDSPGQHAEHARILAAIEAEVRKVIDPITYRKAVRPFIDRVDHTTLDMVFVRAAQFDLLGVIEAATNHVFTERYRRKDKLLFSFIIEGHLQNIIDAESADGNP